MRFWETEQEARTAINEAIVRTSNSVIDEEIDKATDPNEIMQLEALREYFMNSTFRSRLEDSVLETAARTPAEAE